MPGLSWQPPVNRFLQSLASGTREAASSVAAKKLPTFPLPPPEASDPSLLVSIHPTAADVARVEVWNSPAGRAPLLMLWIQHRQPPVEFSLEGVVVHIAEDLLDEGGTGVGSLFAAAGARSRLRLKCLRSALKAFLEHPAFQTSREFVVVTDGSRREGSAVKLRSFKVSLPPESVRPFKAALQQRWTRPPFESSSLTEEGRPLQRQTPGEPDSPFLPGRRVPFFDLLHQRQASLLAGKLHHKAGLSSTAASVRHVAFSPEKSTFASETARGAEERADYGKLLNESLGRRVKELEEVVVRLLDGDSTIWEGRTANSGTPKEEPVSLHRRRLKQTREAALLQRENERPLSGAAAPSIFSNGVPRTLVERTRGSGARGVEGQTFTKPDFEFASTRLNAPSKGAGRSKKEFISAKRRGEDRSKARAARPHISETPSCPSPRHRRQSSGKKEEAHSEASRADSLLEWFAGLELGGEFQRWGSESALRGSTSDACSSSFSSSSNSAASESRRKTSGDPSRENGGDKKPFSAASRRGRRESPEEEAQRAFHEAREKWIRSHLELEEETKTPRYLAPNRWLRFQVALGDPSPAIRRYVSRMQRRQKHAERLGKGVGLGRVRRAATSAAFDALFDAWEKAASIPVQERYATSLVESLFAEVGLLRSPHLPSTPRKAGFGMTREGVCWKDEEQKAERSAFSPETWVKSLDLEEKERLLDVLRKDCRALAPSATPGCTPDEQGAKPARPSVPLLKPPLPPAQAELAKASAVSFLEGIPVHRIKIHSAEPSDASSLESAPLPQVKVDSAAPSRVSSEDGGLDLDEEGAELDVPTEDKAQLDSEEAKAVARIRVEALHEAAAPEDPSSLDSQIDELSNSAGDSSCGPLPPRHVHFENDHSASDPHQKDSSPPTSGLAVASQKKEMPPSSPKAAQKTTTKAKGGQPLTEGNVSVADSNGGKKEEAKQRRRAAFSRIGKILLPLKNTRRPSASETDGGGAESERTEGAAAKPGKETPSREASAKPARSASPQSTLALPGVGGGALSRKKSAVGERRSSFEKNKAENASRTPVDDEGNSALNGKELPSDQQSSTLQTAQTPLSSLAPSGEVSSKTSSNNLRAAGPRAAGVLRALNVEAGRLQLNPDLIKKAEVERRRRAQAISEMAVLQGLVDKGKGGGEKKTGFIKTPKSATATASALAKTPVDFISADELEEAIERQTQRKKVEEDLRKELGEATAAALEASNKVSAVLREKETLEEAVKRDSEKHQQALQELKSQLEDEQKRASLLEQSVAELKEKQRTLVVLDSETDLSVDQLLQVQTPLLKLPRQQRAQFLRAVNQALMAKAKEERQGLEASRSALCALKTSLEALNAQRHKPRVASDRDPSADTAATNGFVEASRSLDESVEAVLKTCVAANAQALRALGEKASRRTSLSQTPTRKENAATSLRRVKAGPPVLLSPPSTSSNSPSSASENGKSAGCPGEERPSSGLQALEALPDLRLLRDLGDVESLDALKTLRNFAGERGGLEVEVEEPASRLAERATARLAETKREWKQLVESLNEERARQAACLEECSTADVTARTTGDGGKVPWELHSETFYSLAASSPENIRKGLFSSDLKTRREAFALLRTCVMRRLADTQRTLEKRMTRSEHDDREEAERVRSELRAFAEKRAKCELLLKRLSVFCMAFRKEAVADDEEEDATKKTSLFEAPKARDEMVPSPVRKEDGAKHARRVLEEALFGRSPSQAELDSLGNAVVAHGRVEASQQRAQQQPPKGGEDRGSERPREVSFEETKKPDEAGADKRKLPKEQPPPRGSSRDDVDSLVEAAARGRLPSNLVRDILSFEGRAAPGHRDVAWRPNEALNKLAKESFGEKVPPDASRLQPPPLTFKGHRTTGVWFQFADKERQGFEKGHVGALRGVSFLFTGTEGASLQRSRRSSSGKRLSRGADQTRGFEDAAEEAAGRGGASQRRASEGGLAEGTSKESRRDDPLRRSRSASARRGVSRRRSTRRVIPLVDPLEFKPPPPRRKLLDTSWAKYGRPAPTTRRERLRRLPSEEQPQNLDLVDNALDAIYKIVVGPPPATTASEGSELGSPRDEDRNVTTKSPTRNETPADAKTAVSSFAASQTPAPSPPSPLPNQPTPRRHFPKAVAAQTLRGGSAFVSQGRPKVPLRKKQKGKAPPKKQSTSTAAAFKSRVSTKLDLSRVFSPHENDAVPRLSEEELRELRESPDGASDSEDEAANSILKTADRPSPSPSPGISSSQRAKGAEKRRASDGSVKQRTQTAVRGRASVPQVNDARRPSEFVSSGQPQRKSQTALSSGKAKGETLGSEEADREARKRLLFSEKRAELLSKIPLRPTSCLPPAYNLVPLPPLPQKMNAAKGDSPASAALSAAGQEGEGRPSEAKKLSSAAASKFGVKGAVAALPPRGAFESLWELWKCREGPPSQKESADGHGAQQRPQPGLVFPLAKALTGRKATLPSAPHQEDSRLLEYSKIAEERELLRGMEDAVAASGVSAPPSTGDVFEALAESNHAFNRLWEMMMSASEGPV